MSDCYRQYLVERGYTFKTTNLYCYLANKFLLYADIKDLEETTVGYNTILRYITYLKRTNNDRTISLHLSSLKHFFNCVQLPYNPVKIHIKRTSNLVIHNTLSQKQLVDIYQKYPNNGTAISIRNKVVLGLLVFQGMRTMEISKIKLNDVDLDSNTISIEQSQKINSRKLPLHQNQTLLLKQYLLEARNAILNGNTSDCLIVTSKLKNSIKSILNQVGLNLRKLPNRPNFPLIRTSVIKNWLKQHDLRTVQYMAGHRYISSTQKYVCYDVKQLKSSIDQFHPLQ